jgi:predicted amidohydrolase YtcJ
MSIGSAGLVHGQTASPPPEVLAYPDVIFHNAKVYTVDEQFSVVEAVAIRDGRFLATGTNARILAMAGPQTKKFDLRGSSVVPGFIDTHLHSAFVGETSKSGTGEEVEFATVESGLEELRAIVAKYPPGTELYIDGPSNKPLLVDVTLAQLDAAAPNHPVAFTCDNNQVVVNSAMLKKRVRMHLPGIHRDQNGNPNGQLRGGAAGSLKYEAMLWPDLEQEMVRQKAAFKPFIAQGLTTIMGRTQGLTFTTLRDLWVRGELEPRVRSIHEFLRENGEPEAYLKRLGNLTDFGNDQLKIIGATVQVVDGSTGPGSARTSKPKMNMRATDPYGPYGQNKWEDSGDIATSDRRNIILANRYGWTISGLHSSGDMSNTILLDAFEEAHKERSLVGRHFGIDHGLMWKPEHYPRIKEMDVIPSVYSKALMNNENLMQLYGADDVYKMQPVKSLITAGIKPAAEADSGPETSAPLLNIQKWVTRVDDKGRQLDPAEKVDRKEALLMYTRWAARYSGEEDQLGSIEAGKLGDLVVLSGDYMTFPDKDLRNLRVLMTVVGGKPIYQAPGAF